MKPCIGWNENWLIAKTRCVLLEKQPINHEDRNVPQPIRSDGAEAIDAGPRNVMKDIQNPNIVTDGYDS